MIAILGGLGAAGMFAAATLCSSRSARLLGAASALAWVMLVGLAVALPWVAVTGTPHLDRRAVGWLALAGIGNLAGLFLAYSGLRIGKVVLVAPIVATEGAIAALVAALTGETVSPGTGLVLGLIAVGIVLAAAPGAGQEAPAPTAGLAPALLAIGAAVAFGLGLYAAGRVGEELPLAWAVLPARAAGALFFVLPLALTSRLRLTREALPLVIAAGAAEVAGFAAYAFGARHGIAVSAVLASQFGAIAALAACVLFRERLGRAAVVGVATIVVGVAALSFLQA